jgi:hypothetical protein
LRPHSVSVIRWLLLLLLLLVLLYMCSLVQSLLRCVDRAVLRDLYVVEVHYDLATLVIVYHLNLN